MWQQAMLNLNLQNLEHNIDSKIYRAYKKKGGK